MRELSCLRCGEEYPSRYYFAAPGVCSTCFAQLPESERVQVVEAKNPMGAPEQPPDYPPGYAPGVDIPLRRRAIAYAVLLPALIVLPFLGAGLLIGLTGDRLLGLGLGFLGTHACIQLLFPFLAFRQSRARLLLLGMAVEAFCLAILSVVDALGFTAGGYGIVDLLVTTVVGSVLGWEIAYHAFIFELPTMPPAG